MFPELILHRTGSGGRGGYTSEGAVSKMEGGLLTNAVFYAWKFQICRCDVVAQPSV